MAINTSHPIKANGKTYDKFAVSLSISSLAHSDGYGVSIAARLTPYCITEEGPELLEEQAKLVVYGDATVDAQSDPVLTEFLRALEQAGQTFILAKGL